MTLRFRLLLVYLMVVLLGAATVMVAIYESEHARRIYGALQPWNDMALSAERLNTMLSSPGGPVSPEAQDEFTSILTAQFRKLSEVDEYRNVEEIRSALDSLYTRYRRWQALPADQRAEEIAGLRGAEKRYLQLVEAVLAELQRDKNRQETRKRVLLAVEICLTVLYVVVIGTLLRRWLLRPMEQLNRQVSALARDEPPPEPLLTAPQEMANLAQALEHARQSLDRARQQLIESERLTTIGQVAAQLAHNLRNPLASIRAAAQFSARHEPEGSSMRPRMQEIIASVDRMNRWIAGLMEVANAGPSPVQPADVVPTLRRVAEAIAPELATKDLKLLLDVPPEGLVCVHDPATLEHALVAMVVNAIEASPLGADILLKAERLSPCPSASGGDPEPRCRISVCDRGSGLPVAEPERIFEFSYSTKQRGMGLGLALARQALKRQGGSAHAMNNPAGGATVYVEVPLTDSTELPQSAGGA